MFPLITLLALLGDRLFGYPPALQRRTGHPVQWLGAVIGFLDRTLNRPSLDKVSGRMRGALALSLALALVLAVSLPLALVLRAIPYGFILEALLAIAFLAQRDLARAVVAVADGLDRSLAQGRAAVSHIVGREPALLDRSDVARAAIESLAENASDAVVAPTLWLMLFGLPGIVVYKLVNTADSMIGHRSLRYRHFGWAAARLDDVVNLPASRLTGLLLAAAAALDGRGRAALGTMWRDASRHISPNAGWPEAAMAGALDLALGGRRSYEGRNLDLPWLGSGRKDLDQDDIRRALKLYARMLNLLLILMAASATAAILAG
ncbi:MAG TPA: adenosylcobinamide-phosphate synthase CbiB [Aestuariivirgaceae bacterium]|nr:adenosylcobinamide-phosphate synthase CbiB [Aestuariivirgaceae bacterium]